MLRGAEETLKAHQPLIICEFEERWLQGMGSSTTQLKAWLRTLGYSVYRYLGNRLMPVPDDEVHSLDNLLLVHETRKTSLSSFLELA